MSNSKSAYPSLQIQCTDRVRTFCLNLGGFRAMEEYLSTKLNDPDFCILTDFDWNSDKIENISLMAFGGLYTDALKDAEVFTIEKAEAIVELVTLSSMRTAIEGSLSRALSPAQVAKMQEESEKKRKERAEKTKMRKKKKV